MSKLNFKITTSVLPAEGNIPEDYQIHVEVYAHMNDKRHVEFQKAVHEVFNDVDFEKIDIDNKSGLFEIYPNVENKRDYDLNELLTKLPEVLKKIWPSREPVGSIERAKKEITVTVYGLRYVNDYQDEMALSQAEQLFGSEEERTAFLKEEGLTPKDCDFTDEEGCRDGIEGWQLMSMDIKVKIPA